MIITIDGPAGAGKSSAAKALARRLGFEFLDTGAMYRAVALVGLRAGLDLRDEAAFGRLLPNLRLEVLPGRVLVNGEDVTAGLRTAEVTAALGPVADSPAVRAHLVRLQQAWVRGRNVVTEGRDQGTVVFPDAACKFFLVADENERARRRHRQFLAQGESISLEALLAAQHERDLRDAARDIAPMKPAPDAIRLDSTGLTLDEVVDRMEQEVRRWRPASPPPGTNSST